MAEIDLISACLAPLILAAGIIYMVGMVVVGLVRLALPRRR